MLQTYKNGQTSVVLRVKLLDSSATTGAGLTGLSSASTGLIISTIADNEASATAYTVAGSTIETITTLGTYAAPTATKCRFKEVDSTNHKGIYELQIADARFAVSSAKSLLVSLSGATNLAQTDFVVQLQSDDPYVAKPTNSNLLSIDASGRVDIAKIAGTAQTARDIGASVLLSAGTGTGQLDFTSGVVKASLVQILGTALTETAGQIAAAFKQFFNIASPTSTMNVITAVTTATNLTNAATAGDLTATMKTSVTTAATAATPTIAGYTGNTPQTGDAYARLGAPAGASVSADVAAVKSDTGTILTDVNSGAGAIYTRIGAPAGASISADVAAIKAVLPSALTSGGNIMADVLAINGDTTSASQMAKTTRAIGRGTVTAASSTTSILTSAFVPASASTVADQWKGRIITFDADTTTAALRAQSTDITANTSGATPTFTVTALTTAPASGDTFSVT